MDRDSSSPREAPAGNAEYYVGVGSGITATTFLFLSLLDAAHSLLTGPDRCLSFADRTIGVAWGLGTASLLGFVLGFVTGGIVLLTSRIRAIYDGWIEALIYGSLTTGVIVLLVQPWVHAKSSIYYGAIALFFFLSIPALRIALWLHTDSSRGAGRYASSLMLGLAVLLFWLDASFYLRLYAGIHNALAFLAALSAGLAVSCWRIVLPFRVYGAAPFAALLTCVWCALELPAAHTRKTFLLTRTTLMSKTIRIWSAVFDLDRDGFSEWFIGGDCGDQSRRRRCPG